MPPSDLRAERSKLWLCAAIAGLVVFSDQGSKFLAVANLTGAFEYHGASGLFSQLRVYYGKRNLDGRPSTPSSPDLRRAPAVVEPHFWNFVYVENKGGAFSALAGWRDRLRLPLLNGTTLIAIAFLASAIRRARSDQRHTVAALSLVLGGALGNYVCRVTRGYVIDFVDWHWFGDPRLHWPTFNLADAAISVGVALLIAQGIAQAWKAIGVVPERLPDRTG